MKNLDVIFVWNSNTYTMLYSVPTNVNEPTILNSIKSALNTYNGSNYLALIDFVNNSNNPYSKGIQPNTTVVQIQNAITAGVTAPIIGGRSRRG